MSADMTADRQRAYEIIRDNSFILGDVTLASGQKSDHYFDMKPTMLHPDGVRVLSNLILDRLKDIEVDCIGGIEMGAVPLVGPLVLISAMQGRPLPGFFVRKTVKEHGTQKRVEGVADISGKHIAIVEDVTTTGGSAMKSIEAVKADGAIVTMVISILDREQGAVALYEEAGLPFQSLFVASEFLNRP